jgi:predicted AlkP superfamily pyrophosphatase or phosphodiesterase
LAGELREGAEGDQAEVLAVRGRALGADSCARPALRAGFVAACLGIAACSAAAQGSGGINAPAQRAKPYVVMISFDGFMPEYLQRIDLPAFAQVAKNGVRSVGMIPVFPSKTFPNHYAIATGMYSESHGIVGNRFWDASRNASYSMSDSLAFLDSSWYRGEPIWATAEKQGMVAASYFWVASDVPIGGIFPTIWKRYDGRVANSRRVDSVLAWLALPAERRPHMVTMYFSDTDGAGHDFGPVSPQLDSAAKRVDAALGRLLAGFQQLPSDVKDRIYLILVSDHGMSESSPRWFAALDTLIAMDSVRLAEGGPLANLYVWNAPQRASVLRDSINRRMQHGHAYLRGELPKHLHYDKDPRVGDVVVVMDDHWQIGRASRPVREGANHGWDPTLPNMHALFVASGPGIPAGKVIPSFENVDIYPYITELLGLKPATGIDGKPDRLKRLIQQ